MVSDVVGSVYRTTLSNGKNRNKSFCTLAQISCVFATSLGVVSNSLFCFLIAQDGALDCTGPMINGVCIITICKNAAFSVFSSFKKPV